MEISPFSPQKLLFHRDKVEASLRGEMVYPISVEIDLSNVCPHDCPFCSFGTSQSQGYRQQNWVTFPYPRILDLLTELHECGVQSVTFTGGGEPLIHKHAAEVFAHATALGLQWGLVTNGLLLTGEIARQASLGATFVRVSLDAGTSETHQITHGIKHPQYDQILGNIQELRGLSPTLTIGASFCVMPSNYQEIFRAALRVKEAGGSYLEIRPVYPTDWRGDGFEGVPNEQQLGYAEHETTTARAQLADSTFQVLGMVDRFASLKTPAKKFSQCRTGHLMTVIGADARIWWCCVQRGQSFFELGSVKDRPFPEVWAEVHEKMDSAKIDLSKCPRCRYDGFNELIEKAFIGDHMHRSFV